jgi:hypothetical protein
MRATATSLTTTFADAARVLSDAAHSLQLVVPGFRTPPRIVGMDRTIRRSSDGVGGVVAVRLRDRPFTAVVSDMIEGVIAINRLQPPDADRIRNALWPVMLQFTMYQSSKMQSTSHARTSSPQGGQGSRTDASEMVIARVA